MPRMLMATKTASSVSTVAVFFAVVALALFTSRSDAFVSPPSVANLVLPYQQPSQGVHHHHHQHHHHHRRRANDRSIPLYAATASGSDIGVINSWKLLPDGRIQGVMADSGDNVLTSPLKKQTGLKEESTVRTVSGSRYRLGTPAAPDDNGNSNDNSNGNGNDNDTNMSPDRLGTPRATVPGVNMPGANGDETPVRATQPLRSAPTASQDRVLNEYVANKGRATIPVSESSGSAPEGSTEKEKKNRFLTPLVGGASAIAVGAAIGSGVVSDKGLDFDKLKNLPDPSKILESTKSLGLPDIKALRAPAIPSDGISLPKFEGLSLPSPKLPDVGIPDVGLKLPDVKLPSAPSVKINVPNGVKNLGDAAGDAIGEALDGTGLKLPPNPFEKKPQTPPSVGMGPYKVPMPYLDQQIVQAKREAAEKEEAARIQKIKEEEQARVKAEEEAMAQRAREREQALKERAEAEALIRKQAEERVQKAEQETARLRTEAEKEAARLRTEAQQEAARLRTQAEQETARLRTLAEQEAARLRAESEKETARLRSESEQVAARLRAEVEKTRAEVEKTRMDAMAKEKAAADESARLKKEVESALLKERAAKEEFSEKLKAAEVAQLNQAQDFTAKLAAAQEAAAKERALAEETILAQKLAAEAATREEEAREALETATVEARQASIGAMAARKATYAKPSLSTYAEWQQRQQVAYEARIKQAGSEIKATTAASSNSASPSSQDNLSTYKRWQQSVLAKQVVSLSAEPVTAAYATGAPAPVANQLISGSSKLSEFATRLNGDLGYTIAGSAALIGGITYGYNYQKIQDEIEQAAETQSSPTNENVAPPSPPVKPLTPVVPPTPKVQPKQEIATSVTMAIDPKPTSNDPVKTSASVTKEVSPRPAKGSYSPFSRPSKSTEPASATVEAIEPQAASVSTAEVKSNTGSYLDSMSKVSDGTASPKTSFSPFANPKKTASNDSLYKPPSGELSSAEERVDDPLDSDVSESAAAGPSYLDSMSAPSAGLKSSYSPFGTPKAPAKDSLYDPPVSVELPSEKDESSPADETNDFVEGVESPANGGSYFDSMAKTNGSGAAAPKASYSPFGATKTWQTSSDSLYDVPLAVSEESSTNEASTTESLEAVTSSQGSYLTGLDDSNAPSGVKKSYSPFGTKPKAVRDNGLYSPEKIHETSLYSPSASDSDLPNENERDEIQVSNYLDRSIIPLTDVNKGGGPVKRSFSPFGRGKPKAPKMDSLYREQPLDVNLPSEEERDNIPVGNYLQRLVVPLSTSSRSKKSFSPFGLDKGEKPKGSSSSNDSLYKPPASPPNELTSDGEIDAVPATNLDRLEVSPKATFNGSKTSYLPFGLKTGEKQKAPTSSTDSSYRTPTAESSGLHELPSDEERDMIQVANYLDRLVLRLGDTSGSGKKSYAPFGSTGEKPKAPTSEDSLYGPPSGESFDLPSEEERDATPVSKYLDHLIAPLSSVFSSEKKSFSPFGDGGKNLKGLTTGNEFLYSPPAQSDDERLSDEESFDSSFPDLRGDSEVAAKSTSTIKSKTSYSPFSSKEWINRETSESMSDTLYKPPLELSLDDEPDVTPVANYLEDLNAQVAGASESKKSYSPFGKVDQKAKASASDNGVLYKPPAVDSSSSSLSQSQSSSPSNEISPQEEKLDNVPSANYLDYLVDPLGEARPYTKKSYSPFGTIGTKPKSPSSDSDTLYMAPQPEYHESIPERDTTSETESGTTGVSGDQKRSSEESDALNYLEALSKIRAPMKSSYSPFASWKSEIFDTSSTDLYAAPNLLEPMDVPHPSTSIETKDSSTEVADSESAATPSKNNTDRNYLKSLDGSISSFVKNSFSPFSSPGESPVSESSTDTLYQSPQETSPDAQAISDFNSERNRIKEAYIEWCTFYGKESSDLRFEIFAAHFQTVEKFHQENGAQLMLNEFSDLTEDEYKAMTSTDTDESIFDPVTDDRIISAYQQWCDWYDIEFSEDRLQVFASNFLILERYNGGESSNVPMIFNEYSDMTEEEYNAFKKKE